MRSRSFADAFLLCLVGGALALLASVKPAFAYLDPGAGSMILQGLIALVAGGLLAIKLYWQKLVGIFKGQTTGSNRKEYGDPRS